MGALQELVVSVLELRPAGPGRLRGLCPFHTERTPSFFVYEDRGRFHCFGCGEHGDDIYFISCFVAYGRCPVDRDRYSQAVTYQPIPEGTPRLVKQLMQIGMGLALANGKNSIDADIYEVVKKIGCDLIPVQRLRLIGELYRTQTVESLDGWRETRDLADALNIPSATARLLLEDMMVVGILHRQRGESDGGRPPYSWQLTDDVAEWLTGAELFS